MVRILISTILLIGVIFLVGCSPIYVVKAAYAEAKILLSRKEIATILADPKSDQKLKARLILVNFARDKALELGLKVGNTFTQYAELQTSQLIWVLSASKKERIQPYTWWFPIVGTIPYKGFFDLTDGKKYAKDLQDQGYDTFLRTSSAFSTLGWFNDPVLSIIVKGDEIALVDTIIHESVHTTLWSKGNVTFNESFANFVGANGAALFFQNKEPEKYLRAKERWSDELAVSTTIANCVNGLNELNKIFNGPELLRKRDEFYSVELANLKTHLSKNSSFHQIYSLNNAQIVALQIYTDRLALFDKLLSKYDLGEIIFKVNARINELDDPYKIIEDLL